MRNGLTALFAFRQAFAVCHLAAGAFDGVGDAGVDLFLDRPVFRPTTGHYCLLNLAYP
jgi:hypothetical protein